MIGKASQTKTSRVTFQHKSGTLDYVFFHSRNVYNYVIITARGELESGYNPFRGELY